MNARRQAEVIQRFGFEVGVAVRRRRGHGAGQAGIGVEQLRLHEGARELGAAFETDHGVDIAVQFEHRVAAGLLVETVDVLREHEADLAVRLEPGQRMVAGVGHGPGQGGPADHAARPVAALDRSRLAKFRPQDRHLAAAHAVTVAVVRDAGRGRQPGAGQHQRLGIASQELRKCASPVVNCETFSHLEPSSTWLGSYHRCRLDQNTIP
jgi:hypothetical protein